METPICPRCEIVELRLPIAANALSRLTRGTAQQIWICSDCGTAEALEDFHNGTVSPIIFSDRVVPNDRTS